MTASSISPTLLRAVICAMLAVAAAAEDAKTVAPRREDAVLLSVTAKVEAIDLAKREVVLKGPLGNLTTITVGEQVKRLDEVAVGDEVTADYYIFLAGELREPTEEERKTPIVAVEADARAAKDALPAGVSIRAFKVLAKIVGLDLTTQLITLQGPKGRNVQIRAASIDNLMQRHLGESVIVTYTEASAISLVKGRPAAKKD